MSVMAKTGHFGLTILSTDAMIARIAPPKTIRYGISAPSWSRDRLRSSGRRVVSVPVISFSLGGEARERDRGLVAGQRARQHPVDRGRELREKEVGEDAH